HPRQGSLYDLSRTCFIIKPAEDPYRATAWAAVPFCFASDFFWIAAALNDRHIWAEDYDSDLTDVFAIQSDLAKKITGELQAKLSPAERVQIERKPTENGEAYLAFLQAHDLCTR